jgi:hypothetical protein
MAGVWEMAGASSLARRAYNIIRSYTWWAGGRRARLLKENILRNAPPASQLWLTLCNDIRRVYGRRLLEADGTAIIEKYSTESWAEHYINAPTPSALVEECCADFWEEYFNLTPDQHLPPARREGGSCFLRVDEARAEPWIKRVFGGIIREMYICSVVKNIVWREGMVLSMLASGGEAVCGGAVRAAYRFMYPNPWCESVPSRKVFSQIVNTVYSAPPEEFIRRTGVLAERFVDFDCADEVSSFLTRADITITNLIKKAGDACQAMRTRCLDIRSGAPGIAGRLSNATRREFSFYGVVCRSIEGVLQSFKFRDINRQLNLCALWGKAAEAEGEIQDWQNSQTLYWENKPFPRGSEEYQNLLSRLFYEVFIQDARYRNDLRRLCRDWRFTYSTGNMDPCETLLTESEFCRRLAWLGNDPLIGAAERILL